MDTSELPAFKSVKCYIQKADLRHSFSAITYKRRLIDTHYKNICGEIIGSLVCIGESNEYIYGQSSFLYLPLAHEEHI